MRSVEALQTAVERLAAARESTDMKEMDRLLHAAMDARPSGAVIKLIVGYGVTVKSLGCCWVLPGGKITTTYIVAKYATGCGVMDARAIMPKGAECT